MFGQEHVANLVYHDPPSNSMPFYYFNCDFKYANRCSSPRPKEEVEQTLTPALSPPYQFSHDASQLHGLIV
jgi:hypothetical protein